MKKRILRFPPVSCMACAARDWCQSHTYAAGRFTPDRLCAYGGCQSHTLFCYGGRIWLTSSDGTHINRYGREAAFGSLNGSYAIKDR